jgi:hypothetical protein
VRVQDEAQVVLVDPHAERRRGDDDLQVPLEEVVLGLRRALAPRPAW